MEWLRCELLAALAICSFASFVRWILYLSWISLETNITQSSSYVLILDKIIFFIICQLKIYTVDSRYLELAYLK